MARALMPLTSSVVFMAVASCTPPPPVPTECSDIDASSCFSNTECGSGYRCTWNPLITNLNLVAVTCCTQGQPGTAKAGAPCTSMDDCASGVCTYTPTALLCSVACTKDSDCPPPLPRCVTLDPVDAGLFAADASAPDGSIAAGGTVSFCGLGP